jgi:putative ABC transport system permease protein
MFKNYIKIALRNIVKHKTFSFINIFGLALAMSICMGIIMLVADQMMIDRHNTNSSRIYRINTIPYFHEQNGRFKGNETATTTLPLRDELLANYTGIEKAVRLMRGFGNGWLELEPSNDVNIPVSGYFADPEVLDMFQYELQYGNPQTALVEPYSVVLSKEAAEKLFSIENPVGESVKVGKLGTYKVTGVIKKTENRSHIIADAFSSISSVKSLAASDIMGADLDNWYNCFSGWVYIRLQEGKRVEEIEPHLAQISKAHFSELPAGETIEVTYATQNLLEIIPGRMLNNPIGPFMPWFLIYFLAAIAGIVLITSCFNFTNLSIARSLSRAREIGVRKVTGAVRWQIFVQFISESVVISLFALVLAIGMIYALRPFIVDLAFARFLKWNLSANYIVFGIFLVLSVVVGIVAGLFPAGVLSGFQPIKVLKNLNNTRLMSKMGLRKALLVVQFSLSMIFVLSVIVLYKQMNLFLQNDNGFAVENRLIIHNGETSAQALKTELEKQSNIINVSMASHVPMTGINYGSDFKKSLEEKESTLVHYFSVDEDYLEHMRLTLVAGNFFTEQAGSSNKNFIILNEEAVKRFQFGSPIDALGKTIYMVEDSTEKQIIGVVKNYQHEFLAERLEPLALIYNPEEYAMIQVAYTGNYLDASATVEKVWAGVNPGLKIDMKELSVHLGTMYEIVFGTIVKVLGFIAFLAITISCLGLLGMATYTIETRKKEIAMRKILGSSNRALIYILSKGYFSVLLLALGIAIPAAYYLNTFWLQNLATHVTVDVVTIGIGTLVLILLGVFTIGSQTLQAIVVNPVENLKND